MNSKDVIEYSEFGFDTQTYVRLQQQALTERIHQFPNGTLYLEIGGKFLYDPHAARVLPGFIPTIKPKIFTEVGEKYSVIYCVNAEDIEGNRMLNNTGESYVETTLSLIHSFEERLGEKPRIAINLVTTETKPLKRFREALKAKGYQTFLRYKIAGYPQAEQVISEEGYGKDEYIPVTEPLVLVIGPASNSGKLSTCLGQVYLDQRHGRDSGFAKYELFPIHNLPLEHPVNLAYEAATADIGDYNLYDPFHSAAYDIHDAVNYNRDVDAFPIIQTLLQKIVPKNNFMHRYKSPTDMGMNKAGFAITNDKLVARAATEEIKRRIQWFSEQVANGHGETQWVEKCKTLLERALKYQPRN